GRRIAIKLLLPEYNRDAELVARFHREADIVAKLGHPHIVTVFHAVEAAAGFPFLFMELLDGETLGNRLHRVGRLSLAETVRIAAQVASALTCTHEHGVVH